MARRALLGVDCGTQSTKVLVVDASSEEIVGSGQATHEVIERADGTREQDPDWWVSALQAAVHQALPPDVEVVGIGVSGQQHGLVCLDSADCPLRPAKAHAAAHRSITQHSWVRSVPKPQQQWG